MADTIAFAYSLPPWHVRIMYVIKYAANRLCVALNVDSKVRKVKTVEVLLAEAAEAREAAEFAAEAAEAAARTARVKATEANDAFRAVKILLQNE